VAILIHTIKKKVSKEGKVSFSYKVTPEKVMLSKNGIVTISLGTIDLNQHSDIYIAEFYIVKFSPVNKS